ncbi:hypothetical protein ROZALSC1DRAFT_24409, partial [Rozella allomycis CSF55]
MGSPSTRLQDLPIELVMKIQSFLPEHDCISFLLCFHSVELFNEACKIKSDYNKICSAGATRYLRIFLPKLKKTSDSFLTSASRFGRTNVLDWFVKRGFELKCPEDAINWACNNGHVDVLEWWKKSGLELKWSEDAMDLASENDHVDVLDWWKKSGLELKWNKDVMIYASGYGHLNVLEWWKNSGLEVQWSEDAMDLASEYGHVKVLE